MTPSLVLAFSLLLSTQGGGNSSKLSPDISKLSSGAPVQVIVQYVHSPTDRDDQKTLAVGGLLRKKFKHTKSRAIRVPRTALAALAADPNVAYVSPDRPVHAKLDYTTTAVNAPAAWSASWVGTGVGVAVIDSGISAHPDLTGARNR